MRMLIYTFLLLSITIIFYILFGNPYCSFANARVFVLYLDDILVLTCSTCAGKGAQLFHSLSGHLWLHSNFPNSGLHLTQHFSFIGLFWDTVDMCVSLPAILLTSWDATFSSFFITDTNYCYSPSVYGDFFGQDHLLYQWTCTFCQLCHVIQSNLLNVYNSLAHLVCSFHLFFSAWHQLWRQSPLQQCPFTLQFSLPDMTIRFCFLSGFWLFFNL